MYVGAQGLRPHHNLRLHYLLRPHHNLRNAIIYNVLTSKLIMTATGINHIQITSGVCGGKPRIAGHRIKVQDVVIWHERMGMSPDEIVYHYPSITLADVYAALSYYHDHLEDIRQDIKEDEVFSQEMQAVTPSLVKEKLRQVYEGKD
jgi:uncharacterized protein (DUF433 family)